MGGGHTNGLGGQACAQPHRHLLRCILPHDASAQLGRADRPWRHAGRQASYQAHQPIPHHSQGLQVTHVLERYAGKIAVYLDKSEACLMDLAAGSSRSSPCTLLMRDHVSALCRLLLPSYLCFSRQCNPGVGLKAFFDMVHLSPKKLILFGAACSPVTDQIAKAASHWNLVQLTYVH